MTYVANRLVKKLRNYPRTAATLLGAPGLERRFGSIPRVILDLWNDPTETRWGVTFDRWRATHARLRQDAEGLPRDPRPENSNLYLVRRPDGSVYWCLHDVIARMAAVLEGFDSSSLPVAQQDSLTKVLEYIKKQDPPDAVSTNVSIDVWDGNGTLGSWQEDYHLVPMTGVMVDGSELGGWVKQ